ncbi:MAG: dihydroxyacetone kinase subunit DhaL [Synechococcaceae cyanobacterium]|nr:dihydroxyacetone kinase subunit DhaL [Synechococcaceae cyanobacterium]
MAPTQDRFSLPQAQAWLRGFHDRVLAQESLLTELDAAIGDADHGTNMARGLRAVAARPELAAAPTLQALLRAAGMALVASVGGASGPLYGTFLLRCAGGLGPADSAAAADLAAALRLGLDGLAERGRASPGDKTMLDALSPAVSAFEAALADGASLDTAASLASAAAQAGRDGTAPLQARRGRAAYLGERAIGHLDPGAASMALLIEALAAALASPP